MARLVIEFTPDMASLDAAKRSILSAFAPLAENAVLLDRIRERFPDIIKSCAGGGSDFVLDGLDGFLTARGEAATGGVLGAVVRFDPSDAFLEFAAAIATEGGFEVSDIHGWPVLSLGCRNASVTEAGGVNNPAGGGQADG